MKSSSDILLENRLLLYWVAVDDDIAKEEGLSVYHENNLVGYYFDDGFDCYSAYSYKSKGDYHQAHRVALSLAHLNPTIDSLVLFSYMDLLCREKFDNGSFMIDRKIILKTIRNVQSGLEEVRPDVRKFYWVGIYKRIGKNDRDIDGVTYKGKASIIMGYKNHSKRLESIAMLERVINVLIECGNETNTFLIYKDISTLSGLSVRTVKRLVFFFKEDLDNYNQNRFNTTSYGRYIKIGSISKITNAIRLIQEDIDYKLSQRKVSRKSELHFNTVCTLWQEEDVQEALTEYNHWVKTIIIKK